MKTQMKLVMVSIALIAQIACQSKHEAGGLEGKKLVYANAAMSSVELTEAAEQLLTPTQFMMADSVLEMALEKDPTNLKAQFYKAFLKSFMKTKGILTRIKPLVKQYGDIKEYEKNLSKMPDIAAYRFLLDGKQDISDVKGIQNWLSEYQIALNDFRKFLIENQSRDVQIEVSSTYLEDLFKDSSNYDCQQVNSSEGSYTFECDFREIAKRKLTAPDFMAIRQGLSGMVFFMNFYTAYSFEGVEVLKAMEIKETASPKEVLDIVKTTMPNFGKLRDQHLLKEVQHMGSDFVQSARWAITYQNKICPTGKVKPGQRKGYLFSQGICVENANDALKNVALVEEILTQTMKIDVATGSKVEVDAMAWFKNPVQNILTLAPTEFNSCGEGTKFADNTLGGLFVNGDLEKWITTTPNCK